ncbi:DUF86 domain-containing protein [bacterium]|nr:DUF86 domain-containing protein [bacterium]
MSRDPAVYLDDMLEAIGHIRDYTAGMDRPTFEGDQRTVDAVVRNFLVLGEAAKGVPPELRQEHAEVDWSGLARLRDVLVHRYFATNMNLLWELIQVKVVPLEEQLCAVLSTLDGGA